MENTFLPSTYEKPATQSKYYRFQEGDNYFRILSSAIIGWVDWQDTKEGRKPIRTKEKPAQLINPAKPAKHFWAFVVWDYKEKKIKIMEITQATIQDAILALHKDMNWGSPLNYDITIKKTGKDMETKYNVMPVPPRPLSDEIKHIYSQTKIDLEKLYTNEDPFADEQTSQNSESYQPEEPTIDVNDLPIF